MTDTNNHYRDHADEELSQPDLEASVANAEQGYDMDEAVRHTLYIGWIMGRLNGKQITGVRHGGGNRLELLLAPHTSAAYDTVTVVIPYPAPDWTP